MRESFHLKVPFGFRSVPSLAFESALLLLLVFPNPLLAQTRQAIHGRNWALLAQASDLGEVEKGRRFHLAVVLPLRNTGELDQFLKDVYDPKSPTYHHFLRQGEFGELYGPTQADVQAVADYFSGKGFTVTKIHGNRVIVDVEGDNDAVEKAFHVRLHNRRRPDGTIFFAPNGTPQVDLTIPLDHVSGLDNFQLPRPAGGGSAPGGSYYGIDFRNAYASGVTLRGDGQSIAFFEMSNYYPSDVQAYQQAISGTSSQAEAMYSSFGTVSPVYTFGISSSSAPTAENEVAGDVDYACSMAPAANMVVYIGSESDDVLNQIAQDDTCQQISSSWVNIPENDTSAYEQFAAQGQSFFQAAGDWMSFGSSTSIAGGVDPDDPAYDGESSNENQADITLVGGTQLSMNGTTYGGETVWNQGSVGTGGGILNYEALPFYQSGMNFTAAGGSATNRNAPDVAACAYNFYMDVSGGWGGGHWGTSFATPIWAGFIALANQQRAAHGQRSLGFANPVLYAIGQDPVKYAADFHDITTGNNTGYNAVTGFDLATGWGSPNGQSLIDDLVQTTGIPSPTSTPTSTPTPTDTSTITPTPTFTLVPCNGHPGAAWSAPIDGNLTNQAGLVASVSDFGTAPVLLGVSSGAVNVIKNYTAGTFAFTGLGESSPVTDHTDYSVASLGSWTYVAGGLKYGTFMSDVWKTQDFTHFTQVTASASFPGRINFGMVSFNNQLWIIGGTTATGVVNDIWSSPGGAVWTQVTANAPFSARMLFDLVVFNGKLWVIGGQTSPSSLLNDVWCSTDGINWIQMAQANPFPVREGALSVVCGNALWLMGGSQGAGPLQDVWVSTDGSNWTESTANAGFGTHVSEDEASAFSYNDAVWIAGPDGLSMSNCCSAATSTPTATFSLTATVTNTPTVTETPTETGIHTSTPTVTFTPTAMPKPLVVYPNPVTGNQVHLQLPGGAKGTVKVTIFTLAFRCVRTVQFNGMTGGEDVDLNLVDDQGISLANGLYYIRVWSSSNVWLVTKLLVLR